MKKEFLNKKKISRKINSHYFIWICTRFSSLFLEKYRFLNSILKNSKQNKINKKYFYIVIQYLVFMFHFIKDFNSKLTQNFITILLSVKLKKFQFLNTQFKKFMKSYYFVYRNSFYSQLLYYFCLKTQKIKSFIQYHFFLHSYSNFLNIIKKTIFYSKRVKKFVNRVSLINYNQSFKILNQHKLVYSIEKVLAASNFGYKCEENNSKFRLNNHNLYQTITNFFVFLKIVSNERIGKLNSIYFFKKKNLKNLKIKNFNLFNIFCMQFFNTIKQACGFASQKKLTFYKFRKIQIYNKLNNSLKLMNKLKNKFIKNTIIKNSLKRFDGLEIKYYSIDLLEYFFFVNNYFFLIDKEDKNFLNNLIKNNFIEQQKFMNIKKYEKALKINIVNIYIYLKFLKYASEKSKNYKNNFFLKFSQKFTDIIKFFNNKITKSLQIKIKSDLLFFNITKLYMLKSFSLERILEYHFLVTENFFVSKYNKEQYTSNEIKKKLIKKVINLEKISKKTEQKVNLLKSHIKNDMIIQLYKKLNCPVLRSLPKEVIIYKCGHLFSSKCIKNLLFSRNRKCPVCGEKFGIEDIKQIFLH